MTSPLLKDSAWLTCLMVEGSLQVWAGESRFWRATDARGGTLSEEMACCDDMCFRKIALAAGRTIGSWSTGDEDFL